MAKNAKQEVAETTSTSEVRIKPDLTNYVKGVSGTGKKTMRINDATAIALEGLNIEEVYAVASGLLDVKVPKLQAKYGHLNVGMQRMNLGNRIRGAVTKQDKAHEADNKVASGGKLLEIACEKPRAAAAKRLAAADKAKAEKAKAAAEAKAKADKAAADKAAAANKEAAKANKGKAA
jgi:colicin import membrane protein